MSKDFYQAAAIPPDGGTGLTGPAALPASQPNIRLC
jgi:hypothetical protein